MSLQAEQPVLHLSYKLFDRWIHQPVVLPIENWRHNEDEDDNDESVMCYGDVSPRHFRLIDRVISYLIPQLKKLTIDITWNPALHNPKLQVPNLNAVTIHSTEQGVEFICSDSMSARIDVNVKDAFLQLVYEKKNACHCLTHKTINISELAEAVSILKVGVVHGTEKEARLSPRRESYILSALKKLDVSHDTSENLRALQQVLSSLSSRSSFRIRPSFASVGSLWIQYGIVPCLISLLLDPTKNHEHGLFQNIKNVCKALMACERELASKAIVLYVCRALQQYGLQCRSVLVLLSSVMEESCFRKIGIEQFDLGQTFARLLLVRTPFTHTEMTCSNEGDLSLVDQHMQVPPIHVIHEQLRLPDVATAAWRVPPLPVRRNPPEQSLAQISILKNLLLLSPLNNEGVEFRSGHLASMLLAFVNRGLTEQLQEAIDHNGVPGQEIDSCWFFVMRLSLANIHEHAFSHPVQATFANLPRLQAFKSSVDLRPVDGTVRQVLEMVTRDPESRLWSIGGYQLLTDLVTSTPAANVSGLVASHLTRVFPSIQLPSISSEIESTSKASVHLAAFDLLTALLTRLHRFPTELLNQFCQANVIGIVFQALELVFERREMDRMSEDEATFWIQKCWRLLLALVRVCRSAQWSISTPLQASVMSELEDQFAHEFVDPFTFQASDSFNVLPSLKFLSVYLDSPHCLLYEQVHILSRLLRWIRETLNHAWNQNEMEMFSAALEVVAAVSAHVTDLSFNVVSLMIDGLLYTLGWITHPDASENETPQQSDRTVPLNAGNASDWRHSKAGPSALPPIPRTNVSSRFRREAEIQSELPEDIGRESGSPFHSRFVKSAKRTALQEMVRRSFPVDVAPHPASESDTLMKLEHFRSRHQLHSTERKQELESAKTKGLVIPPLDLAALTMVRDWQQGRRSVASTVYSSEYPVRPLSQMSARSALQSALDGHRLPTPLHSAETGPSPSLTPDVDPFVYESELYDNLQTHLPDKEISVNDRIPALDLKPETQPPVKYFNQSGQFNSDSSKDSIDVESSIDVSSRPSVGAEDRKPSAPITITLEKRAHSTSAVDEMALAAAVRPGQTPENSSQLHKVHSFDKKKSKPSLAMRHLVGNLSPHPPDAESLPTPHLWARGSLPSIVFDRKSMDQISVQSEAIRDDASGTAVTVYAGSYSTEAKELELDCFLEDQDEDGSFSEATTNESQALLLAKYQLTNCDKMLDNHAVHASVLKTLLRFLSADYHNKNRERALTKVVSLGLHKHFHSVPKNVLMILKDWAIQLEDGNSHMLLKMLAKQLFDVNRYPSLRRIGRGVFSSIYECSCPVIGGPSTCCVKVVDLPKDPYGMRSMRDLFTELAILRRVQHLPQTVSLFDFGTTEDNMYVVMKLYKMDLLTWRRQIVGHVNRCTKMMFRIFAEVVKSVDALHGAGVVHFDLKCCNVLLDPKDDAASGMYEWHDATELPFDVVLADFGEALFVDDTSNGFQRSRGTQAFMSPEMLVSGSAGKRVAPGLQSDAWSLGCLLFELVSGEPLFDDSDYSEFHTRLTTTTRTLIDPSRVELIPEAIREPVLLCLSYLLVRNPSVRAPLHAVAEWLEHVQSTNVLPEPGRVVSTDAGNAASSVRNLRGFENTSFLPEPVDLEIRKEYLPLSPRLSLMRFSAAKDPWCLSEHRITHVVFVHFSQTPSSTEELRQIRNSTLRASRLLFEVQISSEEECSIHSWTDYCQRCCENILQSCQSSIPPYRIAVVAGKNTGQYLRLMIRYLTQQYKLHCMNLDSSLLL